MNRNNLESCASKLDKALDIVARNAFWVVACWTLFYVALSLPLAREKPFWNDELFTFYISRLPSVSSIWKALLTGAEQLPPFFFVLTRAFTAVFGSSETSFRLPEIFGFWLMGVSLFQFVRVRLPVVYALIAMTFPLVTAAFDYAYEARPYGLVLGFCALALCCWQAAARGSLRALSLIGLALSMAAAISCHYYAVLGVAAIFVGECVRSFNRRTLDFSIWIAFLLGSLPLAFFLPLIKAARSYSRAFWAKPHWTNMIGFYSTLLAPAVLSLFIILIVFGAYGLWRSAQKPDRALGPRSIPAHEISVVLAFLLLPSFAVFIGELVTGAYSFRYAICAVIGVSVLFSWIVSTLTEGRGGIALALLLILLGLSAHNARSAYFALREQREDRVSAHHFLEAEAPKARVVISDPHLFFELSHDFAQQKSATKLTYLADVTLALKYTNTDTVERGLLAFRQWAPLDVRDFNQFCANHDRFLVYGYPAPFEWVVEDLIAGGWKLAVRARNGDRLLYVVSRQREP